MFYHVLQAFGIIIAAIFALAGAVALWRGGTGSALEQTVQANQVLDRRVHELSEENKEQARELAELRGKTDFVLALMPIMKWAESHEANAAERHDKLMIVLEMMAAKYGPEPNGP